VEIVSYIFSNSTGNYEVILEDEDADFYDNGDDEDEEDLNEEDNEIIGSG